MWTVCSFNIDRFKIALTVYTFALLLGEEDVKYNIHNSFIFRTENIDL